MQEQRAWFMNWRSLCGLIIAGVVLVGGVVWYTVGKQNGNPVPPSILKQLSFSPFVLPTYSTTDYKLSTVNTDVQMLSYVIHGEGTTITLSEYTQPTQFTDIPEYKDRFLTNVAKQYDTVQTANGIIHLGRMARDDNRQLAIMLEQGLIVFLKPEKELDQTQWHRLGEQLVIQKTIN